jgi:flavin-dependent dehydrogenase
VEAVSYDLAICGGGPAGTAAAIAAARLGARVLLLERGRLPRHKVCGEFVSPESLGLLRSLLAGTPTEGILAAAPAITHARFFADGAVVQATIHPPAAGISRWELDHALWQAAEAHGADCRQQVTVNRIARLSQGDFLLETSAGEFGARAVVDASGRWSNLGRAAQPETPSQRWIGLKAHFARSEQDAVASVDLYFFRAGYCGVQPLAPGRLNVAAMVRADALTESPESLFTQVFALEPRLERRSRGWQPVSDLVTTSPLFFGPPLPERDGILRAGDAAGFIDPFVGDGISLALQTGAMAAEILSTVWQSTASLETAAREYRRFYQDRILPVFATASRVRRLLAIPLLVRRPLLALVRAPGVADLLVRKTRLRAQDGVP